MTCDLLYNFNLLCGKLLSKSIINYELQFLLPSCTIALINLISESCDHILHTIYSHLTHHRLSAQMLAFSIPFQRRACKDIWRACQCSNCSYHNASTTLITGRAQLGLNAAEKIGNHSHLLSDGSICRTQEQGLLDPGFRNPTPLAFELLSLGYEMHSSVTRTFCAPAF